MAVAAQDARKARTQRIAPASTAISAAAGARFRTVSGAAAAIARRQSPGEMPPLARSAPSITSAAAAAAASATSRAWSVGTATLQTLPAWAPRVIGCADAFPLLLQEYGCARHQPLTYSVGGSPSASAGPMTAGRP